VRVSPVTPTAPLTLPFVGAARFGTHASGTQVGAVLQVLLAWHTAVAEPLRVWPALQV
jgi:hypothetical protein